MSDADIVELGFFVLQSILALFGTFSILAKITPWSDKELAKQVKENPEATKKWLARLVKFINLLGLTKRNK